MRALTNLFLILGIALMLSTSAGAVISVGLVQVGGTYSASVGAQAGDTLVLDITYGLEPGDATTLVDPAPVWDGAVASFDAAGSTETAFAAWSGGAVALNPIATGDIALVTPNRANGWEKGTTIAGGASSPCVFGACSSLGTAAFVLSGNSGLIWIGAAGLPGGTVIGDGTFQDLAAVFPPVGISLGSFTIVPEPATAGLLGLGILGLTVAGRRRRV